MTENRYLVGVDLGGTKILAGLFDDLLRITHRVKVPTQAEEGPAAVLTRVHGAVEQLLAEADVDAADGVAVGLGVPGQVVPGEPVVRFAPNLDWRDIDLRPHLPGGWNLTVENDVRAGTFGEFRAGAARGAAHALGVFAGTGVGGALILDGRLYHGFLGHAGEIGHTVVHYRKGHSLEQVAGRRSMGKRAAKILADAPKRWRKNWKDLDPERMKSSQWAKLFEKDDPVAVQVIDESACAIGASVGGLVNLLSPEVVVLGGGVAEALGEPFRDRVWEAARRYVLPGADAGVRFVPAELGDDAGVTGAAALAREVSGPTR